MLRPSFMLRLFAPLLLLLVVWPLGAGCGGKMKANTEHASGTDFAQYKTYRWITEDLVLIQGGTGNEAIRNEDNEKRIRTAVDRELQAKGLTEAEGDDADLIVAFTVGTKVRYRLEGGAGYSILSGKGGTVTRGTLTLYLFDRTTQKQVWEAWTSKDLDPEANPDDVVNAAVSLLIGRYPPAS